MNDYERHIFHGKCPYTTKLCDLDIDCVDCWVVEQARQEFEELEKDGEQI